MPRSVILRRIDEARLIDDWLRREGPLTVVTADSDRGMLVPCAERGTRRSSRLRTWRSLLPRTISGPLIADLAQFADEFDRGAIARLSLTRLPMPDLPIR